YFPPGHYVDDAADLDGDGLKNLAEYAFAFSPVAANSPGAGLEVSTAPSGFNTLFTMAFRRDPRAVDLTYNLQTSSDLVHWTTLVQSIAGAVPTGSALVSDVVLVGESPVRIVTARQLLTSPRQWARMQIIRQ
ncbi:MAG: hypothetical protein JWO94_137, partial [Verrucomicrobiaceae bacterium]|nr:hypothetical protein [Verrucomicrobiaceae bacterium]